MTRPCRLSVCMICKDGEASLQTLLPALAALADELIFVDTGSTDGSVELARHFGARTHVFPWTDDFGAARNEALRHATGDWIFVADCDDLITPEAAEQIRAFIQTATVEGGYIRYENELLTPAGKEVLVKYKISLFRNRPTYRYRDPIHETIDESLAETVDPRTLPVTSITIRHQGYLDAQTVARKNERNMRIVQKALQKDGPRVDLLYCLGICQLQQHDYSLAWQTLTRVKTSMEPDHPLYGELLHKMASCLLQLQEPAAARALLAEALSLFPDHTDLYYHCAVIDFMQHNEEQAIQNWQRCIELGEGSSFHLHLQGTGSFMAWHGLAQAHTALKNFPQAVAAYLSSLRLQPDNDRCLKQLLIVLADHFCYEEALSYLETVFAIRDAATLIALVSAALQIERVEFAYQLLASAEDTVMKDATLQALAQLVLSRLP